MLTRFFLELRAGGVPVSLREYLTLLDALRLGLARYDVERFHALARAALVKDERHFDRYDQVFGQVFKGLDAVGGAATAEGVAPRALPESWLRKLAEKHLTDAERAEIERLGGLDALMKTLAERLAEQRERHEGGSKWIGTAGTSPFGAYGDHPEGVRIGQAEGRRGSAVKIWDQRRFRDLADDVEIGTRSIKVALRRLRRWARNGSAEEFDLGGTIDATARRGFLDVRTRPERRNAVKVLLFMDVGGSMDDHVRVAEELFSAARSAFARLEHFYFHNCVYEGLWTENARRWTDQTPTEDVLRRFGSDHVAIFVGDAAMGPYEITHAGGSVEHWNAEPGAVWLSRMLAHWPRAAWLNPSPERYWRYTGSTQIIERLMEGRMYPTTLDGLDRATRALAR